MAQEVIKPEDSNDSKLDMDMPIRTFWNDWSLSARLEHYVIFGDVVGMADVYQNESDLIDVDEYYQNLSKVNRAVDLGFGVRAGKAVSRYFDIGLELAYGSISGVKQIATNQPYTIAHSEMDVFRFGADIRWNFSKYIFGKEKPKTLIYLDANVSGFSSNGTLTKAYHKSILENEYPNSKPETKEFSYLLPMYGLGLGAEFLLSEKLSLDVGSRFFITHNDKIDGLHEDEGFDNKDKQSPANPHHKSGGDAIWNSYVGLAYDFSKNVVNSQSNKWHKGTLLEDMGNDTTEIVIDEDASRVDTVYIKETIIEKPVEIVKVKTIIDYNHVNFDPVYFDLDKHSIREDQFASIEAVANFLKKHPEAVVELEGNTDASASEDYNLKLSEKRVQSVREVLLERYGISADRIKMKYNGEEKPKYELPSLNRRVDFNMESTKKSTK